MKILVGAEAKEFSLPKAILCHGSPFFEKALAGSFEEAASGTLKMPETSIKAFECGVAYMVTIENRFLRFHLKDFASEADFITTMVELSALSQTLLLANLDKCATTNLRGLLDVNSSALTSEHVALAFELLAEKSECRAAIVRATMMHFAGASWDVATRDISADWKFAEALTVPGYVSALLILMKDYNMGRFRV